MTDNTHIQLYRPEGMYNPESYAHVARVGNTLYVAGQVSRGSDGKVVAPNDAAGQAEQVYDNLERALAAAGATLRDVVKITTFLTDRADSAAVTKVRFARFGDHRPPHTGLIVQLGGPEIKLEVEVIAVLKD
jgi:2-iminobutanoate/2-iminopropanoate deaminase